jgi:hypothetical protein
MFAASDSQRHAPLIGKCRVETIAAHCHGDARTLAMPVVKSKVRRKSRPTARNSAAAQIDTGSVTRDG